MRYLAHSPIAFAHRGGAALWPENTIAAFRGALDLGLRWLETDVHATRDGHVVCIHDETVDRTTDGVGFVRDLDLAELRALDAGYRFTIDGQTFPFRGLGLRVPTLAEVLALDPTVRANVEIKQREPPIDAALWRAIDECDAQDRLLIAAAHDPLAVRFRAHRPSAAIATSAGIRGTVAFWLRSRLGLSAGAQAYQALQVPFEHHGIRVVDRAFVRAARARGLHVHVWTIDDEARMHELLDLGVDGLMTDRPDVLARVFHERGLPLAP